MCMGTGYKTLPHFIESENSLLCPQGSLNPAHTDEPYLNKIYFYTIISLLPWFPKQTHRFSFWNESVTCISPLPLCSLYVPLISYVPRLSKLCTPEHLYVYHILQIHVHFHRLCKTKPIQHNECSCLVFNLTKQKSKTIKHVAYVQYVT